MPVIPAPMTSTSTSAVGSSMRTGIVPTGYSNLLMSAAVPFPIAQPDRIPKERYFHPDFYALEAEELWPRVWQMACRLEEIPFAGDYVEYEFLDQSVVVVRTDDGGVT